MTDWFVPNADQLLALTGRRDLGPAIKDVIALGTTAVAVTCGAEGCLVAGPGQRRAVHLPALEVEVVDTTGCGDGFTAGLLAGLLAGTAPEDAAWLGLACGALVATGLGSDAGIENLGQVLSFLQRTQPGVAGRIRTDSSEGAHLMSDGTADRQLRERARAVIPGGMYGHQAAPGAAYPQFMRAGRGARVWDADGNEYVDLMCSYGPVVLGHQHPKVEAAAARQAATGDCMNAPGPVMVDLAELLAQTVRHADWAMFAKNGTDATTMCCTIARAQTGRSKILVAKGAYHGAAPWCTPRPAGTTAADHANLGHYTFNDLASVQRAAAEAGDDLAGILVSPFKHDAGYDQELVDPAFARGLRALCDATGAALILDDVRCRVPAAPRAPAGSRSGWTRTCRPGARRSRTAARSPPCSATTRSATARRTSSSPARSGSPPCPMAAAIATITALKDENAIEAMDRTGTALRDGIVDQARSWDLAVNYTGPPVMPYLTFAGDQDHELAGVFAAQALRGGAYLHPRHNWFVSAAMTGDDLALALEATDQAFAAVRKHLGQLAGGPPCPVQQPNPTRPRALPSGRRGRFRRGGPRAGRLQAGAAAVAPVLLDVRDRLLDHLDHHGHLPELRVRPGVLGAGRRSGPGRSSASAT